MREIKFRAWHESKNGQVMLQVGDKHGTTHPLDCCVYAVNGQPVTLMQYTGLKDKVGKEIYEGDIVKADWGQGELVAEIMFEDAAFVMGIRGDCYRDMAGEDNNLYYEVIGNIWESPQLMEK